MTAAQDCCPPFPVFGRGVHPFHLDGAGFLQLFVHLQLGQSEISEFQVSAAIDYEVLGFQVPVDDIEFV